MGRGPKRAGGGAGGAPPMRELAAGDQQAVARAEAQAAEAKAAATIDRPETVQEAAPVRPVSPGTNKITPTMAAKIAASSASEVMENTRPLTPGERRKGAANKRRAERVQNSNERVHDKKMWVLKKPRQKLRDQTDKVWRKAGSELNMDPKEAREAFRKATGMRRRGFNAVGVATMVNPVAGATVGALSAHRSYNKWRKSDKWENSNFGQAMARNLGTTKKGHIRSVKGHAIRAAVPTLATAAGTAAAFGTPFAPVAGLAMGGYAAGKSALVWRDKRALDKSLKK